MSCRSARLYRFFAPLELLGELVEDRPPEEREVPPEDRLLPADERELPPDERELPTDRDRGAEVRPELLRVELGDRLLGARAVDRLLPVDVGERP